MQSRVERTVSTRAAGAAVYGEAGEGKGRGVSGRGKLAWNSGIFLWSVRTLTGAIREHCPAMAPLLEKIAALMDKRVDAVFAEVYPQCENISVDYAVLEPRSKKGETAASIVCLPETLGGTIWVVVGAAMSITCRFRDTARIRISTS